MSLKIIIKKYFIGLLSYLFILIILNELIGTEFMELFKNLFFENGEILNHNIRLIRGDLEVLKLFKFIISFLFLAYTIMYVDLTYSNYKLMLKEEKRKTMDIQNRIKLIFNNKTVVESDEYIELDNIIKKNIYKQLKLEEDYNDRMTKLNLSMAFLAHDLRTPLTSIIGYSDLLVNEIELSELAKKKYYNIIKEKSNDLEKLIDQFFLYTKSELQIENLKKIDFDIYEFFVQIRETFYPYAIEKKLKINLQLPGKQNMLADPEALARCFNNILKNAVLYSVDNSTINIIYEKENDNHIFIIENKIDRDKNRDIEEKELFHLFYRGDYSRNQMIKGSGLGLNIAKTIIEKHKGSIDVKVLENIIRFKIIIPL